MSSTARCPIELEGGGYDNRPDALVSAAELQNPRNGGPAPGAGILRLAKSRAALAGGDHQLALDLALEAAESARLIALKVLGYLDAASIYCEQGRTWWWRSPHRLRSRCQWPLHRSVPGARIRHAAVT